MSAIWGFVNLDNREADYNLGVKMEQAMNQYKIDRYLTTKLENAVFGCGNQYITKEAINEQLPYFDEVNNLFYTADCMLDNRKEIMEELLLKDTSIPDGTLLYQAYVTWGEKFTDHVLGVFSLVIYDRRRNTCILFTDHTGSRSLYYCLVENTIYFATVFAPLLAVLPKEYRMINEKWMATCEFTVSPAMDFFPGLTPFEKVHQVLAGNAVTFQLIDSEIIANKKCYWSLKRRKKLKFKVQEEYRELFIKTLNESVASVLRSAGRTGITLSSGLDSSSVACIAAPLLEDRNEKLYSFTSVPISEYIGDQNPYFVIDESDGVKSICKAYSNIEPEFVRCNGKNACTDLKRMVQYLEFPHKSRQNMVWLDEIYERAAFKDCKVVLKGQYGNATISQGKILSRVYADICHLRLKSAYHEMNLFCRNNNISRKKALHVFLNELKNRLGYPRKGFNDTVVRQELLSKHNIVKSIIHMQKVSGSNMMQSDSQRLGYMCDMNAFTQLGALDTRFGLYYGLIIRDPLKDKRIIELCASYPLECFVREGVERAGVRNYMRGIVPNSILDATNRRGLQSADYIARLCLDWDKTKQEILEILEQPKLINYIDMSNLEQIKDEVRRDDIIKEEDHLLKALMLCSCSVFLNCFAE